MNEKICTKCGKTYENTRENFHVHTVPMVLGNGTKTNWRGLRPECKACRNALHREYNKLNAKAQSARNRENYKRRKENANLFK